MDYLTTHTSLSTILRGFAPGFVTYKKGCTRLAATSDKVYQLLAHGRWFSPGIPASSTTTTGRHDIAEILLKVALNTKNQSINHVQNITAQYVSRWRIWDVLSMGFCSLRFGMLDRGSWCLGECRALSTLNTCQKRRHIKAATKGWVFFVHTQDLSLHTFFSEFRVR